MEFLRKYFLILEYVGDYSGKIFISYLITGIILTMMPIVMGLLQLGIFTNYLYHPVNTG